MRGLLRYALAGAVLTAGLEAAALQAQTVLGDPRDAARTFASNCSACHKSPRGLAKSGQVAGFLRQHYTTGAEMSAAMAAYLVAAGAAPPEKKSAAKDDSAATSKKGKKDQQQIAATPSSAAEHAQPRSTRGRSRHSPQEEAAPAEPHPTAPEPAPAQQVATSTAAAAPVQPAAAAAAAAPSQPPPMVLDIPLPPMPEGPPADLTQSAFSSSPLP